MQSSKSLGAPRRCQTAHKCQHLAAAPHRAVPVCLALRRGPAHSRTTESAAASTMQRRRLLSLLGSSLLAPSVNPVNASAAFVEAPPSEVQGQQLEEQRDEEQRKLVNPPTYVTATGRIIAIGDLHGSWDKAVEAFRVAGVITVTDDAIVWSGGDTVVVQLGDVLDRGDYEIAIVNLIRGLDEQARQQGGAVYMLNGNHEALNIIGDFRYVTPGAFLESAMFAGLTEDQCSDWEVLARVRFAVYKPGGPMAVELSKNPTVLVVNDTVFAHGGLLPTHVQYGLEKLNNEVAAWMRGDRTSDGSKAAPPFMAMGDASSVMWNRTLSRERFPTPFERYHACNALRQALERVEAKRLVVGHTPQLGGANCECDGCVWRIDVGMSAGVLNRPVQVLEINSSPETGETSVRILPNPGWGSPTGTIDEDMLTSGL